QSVFDCLPVANSKAPRDKDQADKADYRNARARREISLTARQGCAPLGRENPPARLGVPERLPAVGQKRTTATRSNSYSRSLERSAGKYVGFPAFRHLSVPRPSRRFSVYRGSFHQRRRADYQQASDAPDASTGISARKQLRRDLRTSSLIQTGLRRLNKVQLHA